MDYVINPSNYTVNNYEDTKKLGNFFQILAVSGGEKLLGQHHKSDTIWLNQSTYRSVNVEIVIKTFSINIRIFNF